MSRKSVLPQSPRHILIYDEDWQFITDHYGPQSGSALGVSNAIRAMIHSNVARLRARAAQLMDEAQVGGRAEAQVEEVEQ